MKLHYNLDGTINVVIRKNGEVIFEHQFKNEEHYRAFFELVSKR